MAGDAQNCRKFFPQPPLDRVDRLMRGLDGQQIVDPAMIIDDETVGGSAHAHVVNVVNVALDRRVTR